MPLTPGRPDPVPAGSGIGAAKANLHGVGFNLTAIRVSLLRPSTGPISIPDPPIRTAGAHDDGPTRQLQALAASTRTSGTASLSHESAAGVAGSPPDHLEAEGRCASVTRVSGSGRGARRPVSVGAVAALSCCTFSGSSCQRPIVGKMRLRCRDRSSTLRSAAVVGAGRRAGAVWRGRSCPWRCCGWVLYGSPPRRRGCAG